MTRRMSRSIQKPLAYVILIVAFLYMGSFEMVRESSRRPFIIFGHMYSNSVLKSMLPQVQKDGVLKTAKWIKNKEVDETNQMQAGKELFRVLCISCHSVRGIRNDIFVRAEGMDTDDITAVLEGMGEETPFMPPFPGTDQEIELLSLYLQELLLAEEG